MKAELWGRWSRFQAHSGPAPGARVGGVVHLGQMLEVEVRVDLGGADVRVPEQLLHAAQVAARLEQMAGEGMPEHMRMEVYAEPLPPRPPGDAQLHGPGAQSAGAPAGEKPGRGGG